MGRSVNVALTEGDTSDEPLGERDEVAPPLPDALVLGVAGAEEATGEGVADTQPLPVAVGDVDAVADTARDTLAAPLTVAVGDVNVLELGVANKVVASGVPELVSEAVNDGDSDALLLGEDVGVVDVDSEAQLLGEDVGDVGADSDTQLLGEDVGDRDVDSDTQLLGEDEGDEGADCEAQLLADELSAADTDSSMLALETEVGDVDVDSEAQLLGEDVGDVDVDIDAQLLTDELSTADTDRGRLALTMEVGDVDEDTDGLGLLLVHGVVVSEDVAVRDRDAIDEPLDTSDTVLAPLADILPLGEASIVVASAVKLTVTLEEMLPVRLGDTVSDDDAPELGVNCADEGTGDGVEDTDTLKDLLGAPLDEAVGDAEASVESLSAGDCEGRRDGVAELQADAQGDAEPDHGTDSDWDGVADRHSVAEPESDATDGDGDSVAPPGTVLNVGRCVPSMEKKGDSVPAEGDPVGERRPVAICGKG